MCPSTIWRSMASYIPCGRGLYNGIDIWPVLLNSSGPFLPLQLCAQTPSILQGAWHPWSKTKTDHWKPGPCKEVCCESQQSIITVMYVLSPQQDVYDIYLLYNAHAIFINPRRTCATGLQQASVFVYLMLFSHYSLQCSFRVTLTASVQQSLPN